MPSASSTSLCQPWLPGVPLAAAELAAAPATPSPLPRLLCLNPLPWAKRGKAVRMLTDISNPPINGKIIRAFKH